MNGRHALVAACVVHVPKIISTRPPYRLRLAICLRLLLLFAQVCFPQSEDVECFFGIVLEVITHFVVLFAFFAKRADDLGVCGDGVVALRRIDEAWFSMSAPIGIVAKASYAVDGVGGVDVTAEMVEGVCITHLEESSCLHWCLLSPEWTLVAVQLSSA